MMLTAVACGSVDESIPATATTSPTLSPIADRFPNLGEPIVLGRNDSAFLDQVGFRITFDGVFSDDRCPEDAQCPVTGSALMTFRVKENAEANETVQRWRFMSGDGLPVLHTVGDYVFEIVDLTPRSVTDGVPYLVTLVAKESSRS